MRYAHLSEAEQLKVIEGKELVDDERPTDRVCVFAEGGHEGALEIPDDGGASEPEMHQNLEKNGWTE